MASYQGGWLCFERIDGTDRRRLSLTQVPPAWEALPEDALEQLCGTAEQAGRRSGGSDAGDKDPRALEAEQRGRTSGPKTTIGGDDDE
jgi:hypothetical protein